MCVCIYIYIYIIHTYTYVYVYQSVDCTALPLMLYHGAIGYPAPCSDARYVRCIALYVAMLYQRIASQRVVVRCGLLWQIEWSRAVLCCNMQCCAMMLVVLRCMTTLVSRLLSRSALEPRLLHRHIFVPYLRPKRCREFCEPGSWHFICLHNCCASDSPRNHMVQYLSARTCDFPIPLPPETMCICSA